MNKLSARMEHEAIYKWERLGRAGLVVSVCYGLSAGELRWSVAVLRDSTKEEFDKPFAARSFIHAIEIAAIESKERGWLDGFTLDGYSE